MASFYDNPSTTEINTFPPSKPVQLSSPEKKLEFESGITDLRLRRAVEARGSVEAYQLSTINSSIDEIVEEFENSTVDLDDVFAPESVVRPEKPRYLMNQEMDEQIEIEMRRRKPRKPLDMEETEHEFTRRLEQSKQKGKDRAQKRVMKTQNSGPPSPKFYKSAQFAVDTTTTPKKDNRKETAKEIRNRQTSYMKRDDYLQLAKNSPPSNRKKYFPDSDSATS